MKKFMFTLLLANGLIGSSFSYADNICLSSPSMIDDSTTSYVDPIPTKDKALQEEGGVCCTWLNVPGCFPGC